MAAAKKTAKPVTKAKAVKPAAAKMVPAPAAKAKKGGKKGC
jgi:hypothetical protein